MRVKDIDFSYQQVTVRDGKGRKDRVTLLPVSLNEDLAVPLRQVQVLQHKNLSDGARRVWLPAALAAGYRQSR